MDARVGDYLHATIDATVPKTRGSLCIIETRYTYWLPRVIRNALSEFSEWDLYVCAPPEVLGWVTSQFPGVKGIGLDMRGGPASAAVFNSVMFSPDIWNVFQTDYVLVFQCDSVMAPGAASKLPDTGKDFYGAACGNIASEAEFVINGGLSYRRVDAFKKACALLTEEDRKLPEDVAFCKVMRRHPDTFALPSVKECMRFAIESFGDPSAVIGIHGTDKGYCPRCLVAATIPHPRSHTVVDCVSFDGEPILKTRFTMLRHVVDTFVVVESRVTHAGEPKKLTFDINDYPDVKDKIRYVVIDEFPPMPEGFGADIPWCTPESAEAWWRERYQRNVCKDHVAGHDVVIVSDVDEIPDPAVLEDSLADIVNAGGPVHLDMAFLVHAPNWQKREEWIRAFVCPVAAFVDIDPTEVRCSMPTHVIKRAGWHCSSFFDVARQIRKVQHFAHREFSRETSADLIRRRFEQGKDPYGRGAEFDCFDTVEHAWLLFV
jgi:beta-1,4-mannosyl-glycoprotein beta-1,4-N-acetylglucosaminyltransferase